MTGYKGVTNDYLSPFSGPGYLAGDWDAPYRAFPLDYSVGNAITANPAHPGLYVFIDDPDAVVMPVGGGALRAARGTANEQARWDGTVPGAIIPGTIGRVVQVEFDDSDIFDRVYELSPYQSRRVDPFAFEVRVAGCDVVDEIDL